MPIIVSTRFNPREEDIRGADLVLVSSDKIRFYVHQNTLLRQSSNHFGSLLPETIWGSEIEPEMFRFLNTLHFDAAPPMIVDTRYTAEVLNVVLHAVHRFSVRLYGPSPFALRAAVAALSELGCGVDDIFSPGSELFKLFVRAAEVEPLPMYAVAAHHSLESLAVSVSAYAVGTSPLKISEELAVEMGAIYLKRLFFLYIDRTDALKRLLRPPPPSHLFTIDSSCDRSTQESVSRIWTFASSLAIFENHPSSLPRSLAPFIEQLPCHKCRGILHNRVELLIRDWGGVKCTI